MASTSCISRSGAGTSVDPWRIAPVIDSDVRNLASCSAAGLMVTNPDNPGEWTSYTPTWRSSGSPQPVVGNGYLIGRYRKSGHSLELAVALGWGSTTSNGSGIYSWDLPAGLVSGLSCPVPFYAYNSEVGADWGFTGGTALAQMSGTAVGSPVASGAPGGVVLGGAIGWGVGSYVELAGLVYVTT